MSTLERARNELQAGKSGNDPAKLASAETLAGRATADLDQLLRTRIADVKPADVEDKKTPTASRPTRTQIAAADRSLIEARSARDAMRNTISGASPGTSDRRSGDQLSQELDRIANEISRAKSGNDGRVLVTASLVIALGFWVGASGSFRPTLYFSVLSGVTILGALLCDLLILPACLMLVRPQARS